MTIVLSASLFAVSPSAADEMETQCPAVHPARPGIGLRYGECLPDGEIKWSWIPDKRINHGDNAFTDIRIYRRDAKDDPLRKAKIECHYNDRSAIHIPVLGVLLRCEVKYRLPDIDRLKNDEKAEPEILRVWAVSETEDKPEMPK